MSGYAGIVMILNFLVELFLLFGVDRLYGHSACFARMVLAAAVSGTYAGACLLTRFFFLRAMAFRFISLILVALIAFGFSAVALRKGAVFLLLNLALDGLASGFKRGSLWYFLIGAVAVLIMYLLGFQSGEAGRYIPLELTYQTRTLRLMALRDTGNLLRDPVTGRSVIVVDADAARDLTGLTPQQLSSPIETMVTAKVPGLRLIPYHTVGQRAGFMLAVKLENVKIGNRKGSYLVAFAPVEFNSRGTYRALTGGVV